MPPLHNPVTGKRIERLVNPATGKAIARAWYTGGGSYELVYQRRRSYNLADAVDQGALPSTFVNLSGVAFDGARYFALDSGQAPDYPWHFDAVDSPEDALRPNALPAGSYTGITHDGSTFVAVDNSRRVFTWDDYQRPDLATHVGTLPAAVGSPGAVAHADSLYVCVSSSTRDVWTFASPANAASAIDRGALPVGVPAPNAAAWDGTQCVVVSRTMNTLWGFDPLAPADAYQFVGVFPSGLTDVRGLTWDGQQLVLGQMNVHPAADRIWTLAPG